MRTEFYSPELRRNFNYIGLPSVVNLRKNKVITFTVSQSIQNRIRRYDHYKWDWSRDEYVLNSSELIITLKDTKEQRFRLLIESTPYNPKQL